MTGACSTAFRPVFSTIATDAPGPPFEGYDNPARTRLKNRGQARAIGHHAGPWARALRECRLGCTDESAVHPAGRRSLPAGPARTGATDESGPGGEVTAGKPAVGCCRAALG